MLFKNKIEYTKGMFVEIYGTEIKKVRLVLRIITGIAVVAAIAFMIYGAAARGFIMPGDFFNLGISILMALLCTFLPNLMARLIKGTVSDIKAYESVGENCSVMVSFANYGAIKRIFIYNSK